MRSELESHAVVSGPAAAGLVSIVVPTYKEAENLSLLVGRISSAMAETAAEHEIIIVDDDSRDGTPEVVDQLAAAGHNVRLITRTVERGLSSAVIHGFREAKGTALVCMDGDLSHPPEAIPVLLKAHEEPGVDFVLGSRYVAGGSTDAHWGLWRWLNSRAATLLAQPFCSVKDPMSGFFLISKSVFDIADRLDPVGYKIGLELIVKCRCRHIREVPIHFANRHRGESKLNIKVQFNYLRHLKRLADHKFGAYSQFCQFCLVGSTGSVIDLTCYWLLFNLAIPIALARALAIWIAMSWNFMLNRRLTFRQDRNAPLLKQYLRFCVSCFWGAIASWSVSVALSQHLWLFRDHLLVAAGIGILVGTLINFLLSRFWVFAVPQKSAPVQEVNLASGQFTADSSEPHG